MAAINPVTQEQADPAVTEIFEKLTKAFGHMPKFFATMAHRPEVLKHFMPFYAAITSEGTVEQKYKELAYLKTSMLNGCHYCTRAHTASAKKIGISQEQINALQFYRDSNLFDEKEKATILFAERVTRGSSAMREGSLEELKKYYSADEIVELTLTICVANFTNRFNDAMQNEADIG